MSLFDSVARSAKRVLRSVHNATILRDGGIVSCYVKPRESDAELAEAGSVLHGTLSAYLEGAKPSLNELLTYEGSTYIIKNISNYGADIYYVEAVIQSHED